MEKTQKNLILSDLHINSTVALCPPSFILDDGGTYHATTGQKWMWENWNILLDKIKKVKPDNLILNGDIAEGDSKDRSFQLISRNPADINKLTCYILEPLVKMCKNLFVIRGTGAHGGKSGNIEELIAKDLGAIQHPETKAYSRFGLLLSSGGVRFDIAHHTSMGNLPWTSPNAANALAAKVMFDYANRGEEPPDFVIRGHVHRWGDSYDAFRTRAIISPSWSMATEHTHRIAPNSLSHVGAILICGKEVTKIKFEPKGNVWETI